MALDTLKDLAAQEKQRVADRLKEETEQYEADNQRYLKEIQDSFETNFGEILQDLKDTGITWRAGFVHASERSSRAHIIFERNIVLKVMRDGEEQEENHLYRYGLAYTLRATHSKAEDHAGWRWSSKYTYYAEDKTTRLEKLAYYLSQKGLLKEGS